MYNDSYAYTFYMLESRIKIWERFPQKTVLTNTL